MVRYYSPSLPRAIGDAIEDLFDKNLDVRKLYDGNKTKFVEEATRKLIIFYKELYSD